MIKKDTVIALLAVSLIAGSVVIFYQHQKGRERSRMATDIASLTPRGATPATVEALVDAIERYEEQIARHVRDAAQTGVYWKILGIRLSEQGMHKDAVFAFEQAITFPPEEPSLFFLPGESAAVGGASAMEFPGGGGGDRE